MTWGLGKGERSQAGGEGSMRGPAFPPPLRAKGDQLLYGGSQVRHANTMG